VSSNSIPDVTLSRALGWMAGLPLTLNNAAWLCALVDALKTMGKIHVLNELTKKHTRTIASQISMRPLRTGACKVLVKLMMGYQHSPDVFHALLPKLREIMQTLLSEIQQQQQQQQQQSAESIYRSLQHLCECLLFCHTGYPELYEPLITLFRPDMALSETEIPKILAQYAWLTTKGMRINE